MIVAGVYSLIENISVDLSGEYSYSRAYNSLGKEGSCSMIVDSQESTDRLHVSILGGDSKAYKSLSRAFGEGSKPSKDGGFPNNLLSSVSDKFDLGFFFDERSEEVIIVRNVLGEIPIYYVHIPGAYFVFSTSFADLLRREELREYFSLNARWIEEYLSFEKGRSRANISGTLVVPVERLLPGHFLSFSFERGFEKGRSGTFDIQKWSHLKAVGEFGEAFRELFKASVENCVEGQEHVGVQLSGGLDSSFVCGTLRYIEPEIRISSLFLDVPEIINKEKNFAMDVADATSADFLLLHPGSSELADLIEFTHVCAIPDSRVSGASLQARLLEKCRELDIEVMLSGHDGDGIAGHGIEYPEMLFDERRWDEMVYVLEQRAQVFSLSKRYPLWDSYSGKKKSKLFIENFLYDQLLRKRSFLSRLGIIREISSIAIYFGGDMAVALLGRISSSLARSIFAASGTNSILRDDFLDSLAADPAGHKVPSLDVLMGEGIVPADPVALRDIYGGPSLMRPEITLPYAKHYGVTERYPFFDKKLFELSLAVPLSIKYGEGRLRSHMREAMKGLIPENVRVRTGKSRFTIYGRNSIRRLLSQSEDFLSSDSDIWLYVDKYKFEKARIELLADTVSQRAMFYVLRVISLSVWLDWFKSRYNKM